MVGRIKKDKFIFEIVWITVALIIALIKFYLEFYESKDHIEFVLMFYIVIMYVIPTVVNAKFSSSLFYLKNMKRKVKHKKLKENIETGYAILNFSFWWSLASNLLAHSLVILYFEKLNSNSRIFFYAFVVIYVHTFFVGILTKTLNYFEE